MKLIKLNIGPSPIWDKKGWHKLDHKYKENTEDRIAGDAASIALPDETCETIFCGHMIEHVPHTKLETIFLEFNRVLVTDGVVRILVPDLKKVARAYASEDHTFFREAKEEDASLRTDLGLGGTFMSFIVSSGQDTVLMDRRINEFIGGYAHVYAYDFEMLKTLLERTGFAEVEQKDFCQSSYSEYEEPLHVRGLEPVWNNLNQEFYKKHALVHHYHEDTGRYEINFQLTGFDRDPLTSLIVEARKNVHIDHGSYQSLNDSTENYNRYGRSLLKDPVFAARLARVVASATGGAHHAK